MKKGKYVKHIDAIDRAVAAMPLDELDMTTTALRGVMTTLEETHLHMVNRYHGHPDVEFQLGILHWAGLQILGIEHRARVSLKKEWKREKK